MIFRLEIEELVECCLKVNLDIFLMVVDVGIGIGVIVVSLKLVWFNWWVIVIDFLEEVLIVVK